MSMFATKTAVFMIIKGGILRETRTAECQRHKETSLQIWFNTVDKNSDVKNV